MEIPTTYELKFRTAAKPRNEREEMLDKFLSRLNPPRLKDGIPALSYGRLARIFEKVPTTDLYPFFKECEQARNFSGLFWYKVKGKTAKAAPQAASGSASTYP